MQKEKAGDEAQQKLIILAALLVESQEARQLRIDHQNRH